MIRIVSALCITALFSSGPATTVQLKFAAFDPRRDAPAIAPDQRAIPRGERHVVVQLRSTASGRDLTQLRALSANPPQYVPNNAFVLKLTDREIGDLGRSPRVRWIGEFHPAYKLSPDLGSRPFETSERQLLQRMGLLEMVVTLHDGEHPEGLRTGAQIMEISECGPRWLVLVRGTYGDAVHLAKQDRVAFIEDASEAVTRNDITRWVIQSNISGDSSIWARGLLGQNTIGGLIDTKIYMAHNAFRDDTNNTAGPNHRKVVLYNSSNGQSGGNSHGTHTAGTLAGDREPIDGQTFRNGMAPKAKIAFTNLSDISGSNLYSKLAVAYNAGARDHSNSWGDDGTQQYTSWCQQIDQFSWDFEDSVVAFAVTNTSTLKTPENAKSCLAVGASLQAPNQNNFGSGGSGPTIDGRRKPEVYAPGINIWSAQNNTTNGYVQMSGTSMACPAVTGACLLARQWVREGYPLNGIPQGPASFTPITGSLIRALIMNGTVDMTGINGYPSNTEGWGRILLDNVLFFAGDARRTVLWVQRNSNGMIAGQEKIYRFQVLDASVPLKVTMSFTDYPGAVFANNPVVNDVDLELIAPDGTSYKGNVFLNGQSVSGGSQDPKNSTEMVLLDAPQAGVWQARVRVAALNNGAAQGHALVVNGRVQRTPSG